MILHKKETLRRRINPKNWLLNELWHRILKKGILSLTKVKLTVGGSRHGFKQISRCISLYPSSFFGDNIVVIWMYVIFVILFKIFGKNREKYVKPDFVKFISFEINYFERTSCFCFLRIIDKLFFQIKVSFPYPFLSPLFLYFSLPFCQT